MPEVIDVDALPDIVYLPKSGLKPLKSKVYSTIRRQHAKSFRIAASTVHTDKTIRSKLIDIAVVAETIEKARLLDRHEDGIETLDSALEVVKKHFAAYQKALKLLELDRDIAEFSKGIHMRATNRFNVAKRTKKTILNLIKDLENFINEQ